MPSLTLFKPVSGRSATVYGISILVTFCSFAGAD